MSTMNTPIVLDRSELSKENARLCAEIDRLQKALKDSEARQEMLAGLASLAALLSERCECNRRPGHELCERCIAEDKLNELIQWFDDRRDGRS